MAEKAGSGSRRARQYNSKIICAACGGEAVRRSHNQKYCGACVDVAYREDNRKNEERKRRAAGVVAIGTSVQCPGCTRTYAKTNPAQKDCPQCAGARRSEYERVSKAKYAATAPPRKRDSPKDRERGKKWAAENRERVRRSASAYNERNRGLINEKSRQRSKTEQFKEWRRVWERSRSASDPKFNLNARMKQAIKRGLREGKAGRSWRDLIGYSVEALTDHLERQFLPGMSWENMGDWHIDHRQPLVSFKFGTVDDPEFKAAWALTNLQPLWNVDNWSKGGKRTLLL